MAPTDTSMKVKYKVSLFLCLHNDITRNWLPTNISISNILTNKDDDNDDEAWIYHEQDQSHSKSPSKSNFRLIHGLTLLVDGPTILH
jgi:hypothetical protein